MYLLNTLLFAEESSTMDEDMGGGEGVASSDDVNDISSAAQEVLSTGIRYYFYSSNLYNLYYYSNLDFS